MIKVTLRTGLYSTIAAIAVLCSTNVTHANFKYVPDTSSGAAPTTETAPSPSSVTRMPVAPAPQAAVATPQTGGEVINGFGTQVPLVIALREVVPSSFQFAYADGINLGTLVNWKGGKPWRDVLRSVVTPLGLVATEKNSVIYINRSDAVMQQAR